MHEYEKFLREFEEFRIRARHFFEGAHLAAASGETTSAGEWTPAIDVYETADRIVIAAEIAGVRREDVTIEVEGETLTLRGRRPPGRSGASPESYRRMEVPSGAFERSFRLPFTVTEAGVEAVLRDGVLTVTLPRHPAPRGRRIAVETG
ncbi:MAG TPA: Hsp20/alpha crystallin family protein [Candidatus Methanoperedens sp.]|nr:Hsp20/alpha crystallin family protein [Candidatus Methanoperedens sp.]